MKIGYKIIIVAFSAYVILSPGRNFLEKYQNFKKEREVETNEFLKNFKTRNTNFYNDTNYINSIKSFIQKDLVAQEEIPTLSTEPAIEEEEITSTNSGIVEQITENAVEVTTVKAIEENKNGVEGQKKQEEQKKALEQKKIEEAKKAKKMAEEKAKQKKILEQKKQEEQKKAKEKSQREKDIDSILSGEAKAPKDNAKYYVQLGVFSSKANAEQIAKKVGGNFVVVASSLNSSQYVVRSNPAKKDEIERLKNSVSAKNLGLSPIVRAW